MNIKNSFVSFTRSSEFSKQLKGYAPGAKRWDYNKGKVVVIGEGFPHFKTRKCWFNDPLRGKVLVQVELREMPAEEPASTPAT